MLGEPKQKTIATIGQSHVQILSITRSSEHENGGSGGARTQIKRFDYLREKRALLC
jgi:hypothetical protein